MAVDPNILFQGERQRSFGSQVSQFVQLERDRRTNDLRERMIKISEQKAKDQEAEVAFKQFENAQKIFPKGSLALQKAENDYLRTFNIVPDDLPTTPAERSPVMAATAKEDAAIRKRIAKGEINPKEGLRLREENIKTAFRGIGVPNFPGPIRQSLQEELARIQGQRAETAKFDREQAGKVEIANIRAGGKSGAIKERKKAARQRQIGTVAGRIARAQTTAEQKASTKPVLGPDGEPLTEFSLDKNKGLIRVPKTEVAPLTIERRAEIEAESLKAAKKLVPKLRGGKIKAKAKDAPITQADGSFAPTDDPLAIAGQTLISAIRLRQAGDIEGDPLSDSFIKKVLEDAGVDVSTPEKMDAAQDKVIELLKQLQQSRTQ